jgi:hypothetical protein
MKRFAVLAFWALAMFASPVGAMWVTNGIVVNPTAGTVIADTGSINGGGSTYTIIVAANAVTRFEIVIRNPANNGDVSVQNFFVLANSNFTAVLPMDVPGGGRVIIRTPANVTGSVQGSILKDGPA